MKQYIKPETICIQVISAAMMTTFASDPQEYSDDVKEAAKYNNDGWDDED